MKDEGYGAEDRSYVRSHKGSFAAATRASPRPWRRCGSPVRLILHPSSLPALHMNDSIDGVLRAHDVQVRAWLANEPGSWGYLAGQAVLAERRRLGRSLTERERRAVWQALWDRLMEIRAGEG